LESKNFGSRLLRLHGIVEYTYNSPVHYKVPFSVGDDKFTVVYN
jgi:hypothetical protein